MFGCTGAWQGVWALSDDNGVEKSHAPHDGSFSELDTAPCTAARPACLPIRSCARPRWPSRCIEVR